MHSAIVTDKNTPPAPKPERAYPGIYRSRQTGSLWLATDPNRAVVIVLGPNNGGCWRVGEQAIAPIAEPMFERLKEDVTITFHLP